MLAEAELDAGQERRLERALTHVIKHWIPINQTVLIEVRSGLESGRYDLDTEFLLQDVRKDFGLLTYCIRSLLSHREVQSISPEIKYDPVKLLRWAGAVRLKQILCESELPNSHDLKDSSHAQSVRLRETVSAASTTEVLAEEEALDPFSGYTHSIIRQLGINLIAWNYPTVYERVLKSLTATRGLDEDLSKELGFSPALLASVVLGLDDAKNNSKDHSSLRALCSIGEALARASEPETYPSAEADWVVAREYISKKLGSSGISLIRQKIAENTERYREIVPAIFNPLINGWDPEEKVSRHKRASLANNNPFLKGCAPHVRQMIKDLYSSSQGSRIDKPTLELLVKQVVPKAGFSGALIFILDPTSMKLIPRFKSGKITLRTIEAIQWQQPSPSRSESLFSDWDLQHDSKVPTDLVSAAFVCDNPLIERNLAIESDIAALGIYGALGQNKRVGVLYLEAPPEFAELSATLATTTFKAIRHVLAEILRVG